MKNSIENLIFAANEYGTFVYDDENNPVFRALIVGYDNGFEIINNIDYFWQYALDTEGNLYKLYYDAFELDRPVSETISDEEYEHPTLIKKVTDEYDEEIIAFAKLWNNEESED